MAESLSRLGIRVNGTNVTIYDSGITNRHENSHNITHKTTTDSYNNSSTSGDYISVNNLSASPDRQPDAMQSAGRTDLDNGGPPCAAASVGPLGSPPSAPSHQTASNPFSTNVPNTPEPVKLCEHNAHLKSNNPFRRAYQCHQAPAANMQPLNSGGPSVAFRVVDELDRPRTQPQVPKTRICSQHEWESFLGLQARGSTIESSGQEHRDHRDTNLVQYESTPAPWCHVCASKRISQCMLDSRGLCFSHCQPCSRPGPFYTQDVVHWHDRNITTYPQASRCPYSSSSSQPSFHTPPQLAHAPWRTRSPPSLLQMCDSCRCTSHWQTRHFQD